MHYGEYYLLSLFVLSIKLVFLCMHIKQHNALMFKAFAQIRVTRGLIVVHTIHDSREKMDKGA